MQKIIGIYKITSPSGKIYIGQSKDIYSRWKSYRSIICNGQPKLYNSLKKYGWNEHLKEIFQCLESELNSHEVYYIDLFQTFNSKHGMNLRSGGEVSKFSDESRLKMSLKRKGVIPSAEQKIKSMNSRIKNGTVNGWRFKHKPECKERLSKIRKGKPTKSGWNHTDEFKKKMSKRRKGFFVGEHGTNAKIILNKENGVYYYCMKDAAMSIQMRLSTLSRKLSGHLKNNTPFIYA